MKPTLLPRPKWLHEPPASTKRIVFARHGRYLCNDLGVANCDPAIPYSLTELGQEQALRLGERLAGHDIKLIVCSQFIRARETAQLAAYTLRVPIVVNALANENRVGRALEGKPHEIFFRGIEHDPVNAFNDDGGESFAGLLLRTQQLIADLVRSDVGTTLVVAHGWTLQAARHLQDELPAHRAAMGDGLPDNCGIVDGNWCVNPETGLGEAIGATRRVVSQPA